IVLVLASSVNWLFFVDAATFALAALLTFGLGHLGGGIKSTPVAAAIRSTWSVRRARVFLLMTAVAGLFLSMSFPALIALAYSLAPTSGAQAYTLLEAVLSIGVVGGSIWVARQPRIGTVRIVGIGVLLTGVLSCAIAASSSIWLTAIFLLIASFGNPLYMVG